MDWRINKMKVTIVGTGYVGLVTGTCLSDFGLDVICVDKDNKKIECLNSGKIPIYEPNLEALIKKNVIANRLTFTPDFENAVKQSKVIFIAVGTPSNHDGSANIEQIEKVARQIAHHLNDYKVIINKSTVPIGTATKIKEIINSFSPSPLRGEHTQDFLPLRGGRIKVGVKSSSVIAKRRGNLKLNRSDEHSIKFMAYSKMGDCRCSLCVNCCLYYCDYSSNYCFCKNFW